MTQKWKVAFLCRENSCRSQVAEALAKRFSSDLMEVYSAGIRSIDSIDPGAVRMLKETHGIDMPAQGQWPKTVTNCPKSTSSSTWAAKWNAQNAPVRSLSDGISLIRKGFLTMLTGMPFMI